MKASNRIFVMAILTVLGLEGHAQNKPCPALLGVSREGRYFMDRGGAWVRQSPGTIKTMIASGCYPEGGPSPTSSVTVVIAAGAPQSRTDALFALLAGTGWSKDRISVEAWKNPPQRPHLAGSH